MKKESTYNKYKRENKELKSIIDIEVQNFLLGSDDFKERISNLKEYITSYRHNKLDVKRDGDAK